MPVELTVQDQVFLFVDVDVAHWGQGIKVGCFFKVAGPLSTPSTWAPPCFFSSPRPLSTHAVLWLRPSLANPRSWPQLSHPRNLGTFDKRNCPGRNHCTTSDAATSYLKGQERSGIGPQRPGYTERAGPRSGEDSGA